MGNRWPLAAAVFVFAVLLIASLALLTTQEEDPCAESQGDISAAVLAEGPGDQEGLVNRAIIKKGACDKSAAEKNDADRN